MSEELQHSLSNLFDFLVEVRDLPPGEKVVETQQRLREILRLAVEQGKTQFARGEAYPGVDERESLEGALKLAMAKGWLLAQLESEKIKRPETSFEEPASKRARK